MDTLSKSERSKRMSLIKGRDTKPELIVRRLIFSLGYRYRLHRRDLPGKPDIAFPSKSKAIFIHGCFWHRHRRASCKLARLPKSKLDFWLPKLSSNELRDKTKQTALRRLGWKVLVIWECELANVNKLINKIVDFLNQEKK
ncbi:MAG: DNA mismatch endonuclease Vsr [Nitrospirota bacterium]|nr:DNA mismatch endonuclease Vsr [Nitrospirota bacterium]